MDVVRIIAEPIHAHRRACRGEIVLVYRDRRLVVGERVEITAHAIIDVARHVHEMAGAGNGAAQPIGVGLGALRIVGSFHRVDVIVDRAGMIRSARQHALEHRHDGGALRIGLASAGLPIIPGAEIHHRLGIEHCDLVVVRERGGDFAHRLGVGRVERCTLGFRVLRVARRQRGDQRLLARRRIGGERARLLRGGQGRRNRIVLHGKIDVGAEHQRLAPEAHGALRVDFLRLAEGTLRLAMIECIGKPQPLIEIGLRLHIRRRDFVGDRAEAVPQRRIRVGEGGRRRCRLHLRGRHLSAGLRKA